MKGRCQAAAQAAPQHPEIRNFHNFLRPDHHCRTQFCENSLAEAPGSTRWASLLLFPEFHLVRFGYPWYRMGAASASNPDFLLHNSSDIRNLLEHAQKSALGQKRSALSELFPNLDFICCDCLHLFRRRRLQNDEEDRIERCIEREGPKFDIRSRGQSLLEPVGQSSHIQEFNSVSGKTCLITEEVSCSPRIRALLG